MSLTYDPPVYRPPSEADNLILQATLGCSFNRCAFCSMYRSKDFRVRPLAELIAEMDEAARLWPDCARVFLADGDALSLPTEDLLNVLAALKARFPDLARVSAYALPATLLKKSEDELRAVRAAKLTLAYLGIESGSADILKRIAKGASPTGLAAGMNKARAAGMKISATVILGLGGREHWQDHIDATAALINQAPPVYLSTLQLGLAEDRKADFFRRFDNQFTFQDDAGILAELERLVVRLNPPYPVIFRSNHASNALPLAGALPKDKNKLLALLRSAQEGRLGLRPGFLRGF